MDISASQYNSASESGWTHYLDQSSLSGGYVQMSGGGVEEEEEDLSMVSDASSGPPHYLDKDDECLYEDWYHCHSSSQYTNISKDKKKKKMTESKSIRHQQPSQLYDDTASSPVFSCSKKQVDFTENGVVENALDYSQGFSAVRIRGKPKFQKPYGFHGGKQVSKEQGGFREEKRT